MDLKNLKIKFLCFAFFLMLADISLAASRKGILEWRVENSLERLEKAPSFAGERTPFPVIQKIKQVVRIVKQGISQELTESQKRALLAADVLSEIRQILNDDNIFNADVSNIVIDGIIQSDGERSVLIKNRWYKMGGVMDVPIVAKENLKILILELEELDPSLASAVEGQVEEKIAAVHNLNLSISSIDKNNVHFVDEQGKEHVIKFRAAN